MRTTFENHVNSWRLKLCDTKAEEFNRDNEFYWRWRLRGREITVDIEEEISQLFDLAMARKRKGHGHFCWCCGRMRPNERFSGSGHAHHLCKDCSKLERSELQYRQDLRNLEHLVTWEGIIGRKKRKAFNWFLEHPDPRIRRYAEELAARDVKARSRSLG